MSDVFLFSKEHLVILIFFSIFLCFCPKLIKNLLPYSYSVEKIICGLIILEIAFEQVTVLSMGNYNGLSSLPISASRIASYLCIAILLFKKYELFNIFFSWSLVCAIGEIIFFKDLQCRFPNFLYFLYIFSKCLLIYATVYMCEVRKFKVNRYAIKDNLIACFIYFTSIFLLNTFTHSSYSYSFSNIHLYVCLIFVLLTSALYLPSILFKEDEFKFKLRR